MPIFVGIAVDDGAELLPRQRIHPVPWALLSTSAQQAATADTLISGATVTNLRNNGSLSLNSATNYMDTSSDSVVNGIRFWADDGYAWIGNGQNLMTLSPTKGNNINNGLNINGGVSVDNVKPVLFKRYSNKLVNNTTFDTGISANTYECTVAGWFVNMDIDENGYGPWGRSTSVNAQGNWDIEFYNKVHGQTPNPPAWIDLLCFHRNMVTVQYDNGVAAASNTAADMPRPDTASEAVGQ